MCQMTRSGEVAAAMRRVQRGQVSRARHELTVPLAPKTLETPAKLQGRRLQVCQSPIPQEIVDCQPLRTATFSRNVFAKRQRAVHPVQEDARADTLHEVAKSFMLSTMDGDRRSRVLAVYSSRRHQCPTLCAIGVTCPLRWGD